MSVVLYECNKDGPVQEWNGLGGVCGARYGILFIVRISGSRTTSKKPKILL